VLKPAAPAPFSTPNPNRPSSILVFLVLALLVYIGFKQVPQLIQTKRDTNYLSRCRPPKKFESTGVKIPAGFKLHGLDMSHYCCPVDWKAIKSIKHDGIKAEFVFLRATMGVRQTDLLFQQNWDGALNANMIRGAYHYFYPEQSAERQADNFLATVKYKSGDLPPVFDLESNRLNFKPDYIRKQAQIWLDRVEHATGVKPIIYVNQSYYNLYIKDNFKDYPIWLAGYERDTVPKLSDGREWAIWQHTAKAQWSGVSEPVDLNVVNGGWAALAALRIKKEF
jgi:lysozyme